MDTIPVVGDVIKFLKKYKVNSPTKHTVIIVGPKTKWLILSHSYYLNAGHLIQAIKIKDIYDPTATQIEFRMAVRGEWKSKLRNVFAYDLQRVEFYIQTFKKKRKK